MKEERNYFCPKCQYWKPERQKVEVVDLKTDKVLRTHCQDCANGEQLEYWKKTGRAPMSLYLAASMYRYQHDQVHGDGLLALNAEMQELDKLANDFKAKVWDQGLEAYIQASSKSGHRLVVNQNVSMLIFCSAARVLFTIQSTHPSNFNGKEVRESVTLIAAETETPNVGVQGIDAPMVVAKELVIMAIQAWKRGARPKVDAEVRIW